MKQPWSVNRETTSARGMKAIRQGRQTDEWQAAPEEKMGPHTRKEVLLYPVGHKFPTFSQFPLLTASSD